MVNNINILLLVLFGMFLVAGIAWTLIAHIHVDRAEQFLSRCAIVKWLQVFNRAGVLGKSIKCGMMGFVLLMPRVYARKGLVNLDEIARFPRRLKWILIIPFHLQFFIFLMLMLLKDEFIYKGAG